MEGFARIHKQRNTMNFKKINKPTYPDDFNNDFTASDLKMVKVTFTFPVWKNATFEDIRGEFSDSDLNIEDHGTVEESPVTCAELEAWNEEFNKVAGNDWYLYHRDIDYTIADIIKNSKSKPKPKANSKSKKK